MRTRVALLSLAAWLGTLAAQAPVQTGTQPAARNLQVTVGRGELLRFTRDIGTVAIAEPKIADAVVVSPRAVMVNAKEPGQTTLVVWETDAEPTRFDIQVVADVTDTESLRQALGAELKAALPGAAIEFSGNPETILLTGKVADAEQSKRADAIAALHAKKVVNMLKVADPRQIMLQVKFASVDRTALSQVGFNLVSRNGVTMGETSTQQFQGPLFSQLQFQGNQLANTNLNLSSLLNLFLYRPDLNLGATIQALQQKNLLQILAEPNLVVVEGAEASFLAGGEFPFPTITSTPTSGGLAPVVTVQFKKFGVQLNFTPTLTADGAIHLKVKPEVSSLDYTNAVTLQGFLIPAISSRVAETEVVLKDGESFAIAGLLDNRVTQIVNKIKGLGDLPILGALFRSHSSEKSSSELLVVVTPKFVTPLAPGVEPPLPRTEAPFLQPVAPPKTKKQKQPKDAQPAGKQAAYVGPRGYVLPD